MIEHQDELYKTCWKCPYLTTRKRKDGLTFWYCKNFMMPCFSVYNVCKETKLDK